MVEAGVFGDAVEGSGVAGFGVRGGVDEAGEACGVDGAGAHRAGLEGRVEGAAGETPAAEPCGRPSDREEFGVSGGVTGRLAFVGGHGEHLLPAGHDGAHGHLASGGGLTGGFERPAHHDGIQLFTHA